MNWESFTDSQHWDALCEFAAVRGITAKALIEEEDGTHRLVMRTADPRLNPKAVAPCESSTAFRKMIIASTVEVLARRNAHTTEQNKQEA